MKWWQFIIAVAVMSAIAFLAGRVTAPLPEGKIVRDTTTVHDTTIIERPVVTDNWIIGDTTVSVSDPMVIVRDSLIVLTTEQKRYEGENYVAWVSGYRPSLDSIRIASTTKYITERHYIDRRNAIAIGIEGSFATRFSSAAYISYTRELKSWLHVSVEAGYTLDLQQPYVTAGLEIPFEF